MKILDASQMRAIDLRASERYGIPSLLLMENAAMAVVDALESNFPEARRIAIFCGTGNNGGDGFAAARHLVLRGAQVEVFLLGDRSKISGDALTNLEAADRLGIPIVSVSELGSLELAIAASSRSDLTLDAILGTGLDRAAEGIHGDAIVALSAVGIPIVSIDIPSGLDASSARVPGPTIQAALTVTFVAPKIAHVFSPAADHCGEIVVADISIPPAAIEEEAATLSLITPEEVAAIFPPRPRESHKGTWGHVAVIAGSPGRSGAAILAARGALRSGAGLVTVLTDGDTARIVDTVSIETMSAAIERSASGIDAILTLLRGKDAAVLGPGLPDDEEAYAFVRALVARIELPLVIDASALNAFAGRIGELGSERPRILTPHPGELARLAGTTAGEIAEDRIGAARAAAAESRAVVVLKGHQTLVASPSGEVRVNPTGNPGMASGGMGDVLGGMIATLLAQGHDAIDAAAAAVWLHGFAGDLLAEDSSDTGMVALDLAESLPKAIAKLRSSS